MCRARCFLLFRPFLLLCALALCGACSPRQQGASAQGYSLSGRVNSAISVSPPLTLAASGSLSARVPSDINIGPQGSFRYALFADGEDGAISRHVHTVYSELPRRTWRWERETWARPEAVMYSKHSAAGRNWTVQLLPVNAARDWFSALWTKNGRTAPDLWLAKRWSTTPDDDLRFVVEYREPVPVCMAERLRRVGYADEGALPFSGKELRGACADELDAFSARADSAVTFIRPSAAGPGPVQPPLFALPDKAPDMERLVGRAEAIDREGGRYQR